MTERVKAGIVVFLTIPAGGSNPRLEASRGHSLQINFSAFQNPSALHKQILNLNNHKQIITTPTRVTENIANILDHIICNWDDKITYSGVTETGISDHFMTYCTRKHQRQRIGKHKTAKVISLRNYRKETYESILRNINWDLICARTDINNAWVTFKTIITEVMDKIAPVKDIMQ